MSFHILVVYILGSALLSSGCFLLPYVTSSSHITSYAIGKFFSLEFTLLRLNCVHAACNVPCPLQITRSTSVHGAVDGFLMTVLFSVVSHVSLDAAHKKVMWSLTNLAIGLGQLTGLPVAGAQNTRIRGANQCVRGVALKTRHESVFPLQTSSFNASCFFCRLSVRPFSHLRRGVLLRVGALSRQHAALLRHVRRAVLRGADAGERGRDTARRAARAQHRPLKMHVPRQSAVRSHVESLFSPELFDMNISIFPLEHEKRI